MKCAQQTPTNTEKTKKTEAQTETEKARKRDNRDEQYKKTTHSIRSCSAVVHIVTIHARTSQHTAHLSIRRIYKADEPMTHRFSHTQ